MFEAKSTKPIAFLLRFMSSVMPCLDLSFDKLSIVSCKSYIWLSKYFETISSVFIALGYVVDAVLTPLLRATVNELLVRIDNASPDCEIGNRMNVARVTNVGHIGQLFRIQTRL
ncbi:hypothetical protein AVEN_26340-1 [Araneus ventricosus]|uniref:Uncharacterized protein n=1 Tax=Araneus ventricosus TaxID=182803 RepID=A0A4Y2ANX5_ARAVE|nr:hypothetical protein AVEN_26340-1 [Araneus ventricosus]